MGAIAVLERNKMLDALVGLTTYTLNAAFYVQLHIGDPGAAGTANPAAETTRKVVTFGSAAAAGAISNTAQIQWTALAATEQIQYVSFWTAAAAGTWLGNDDLPVPKNVNAGDTLTVAIGDLDLTLS